MCVVSYMEDVAGRCGGDFGLNGTPRARSRQGGAQNVERRCSDRSSGCVNGVCRMKRREMIMKLSPCVSCTRVENPANCENKNCQVWRQWFIGRWDQLRAYPRLQQEQPPKPAGVPLGGRHYAAPHQVRAYLETDPCENCCCPKDLCDTPCRVRKDWDAARNEVQL